MVITRHRTMKRKTIRVHPCLGSIHLPNASRIREHNPGVATRGRAAASSRMIRAAACWEVSAPGCLLVAASRANVADKERKARKAGSACRRRPEAGHSARRPHNRVVVCWVEYARGSHLAVAAMS